MTPDFNLQKFKPRKAVVTMAHGLAWQADGAIYQEKMDGKFGLRRTSCGLFAGEFMAKDDFWAFDCLEFNGEDVKSWPTSERMKLLASAWRGFTARWSANGGQLLHAVLAAGGEGVVRKEAGSAYGPMEACKRVETWILEVVGVNGGSQSVAVRDATTGQRRGNVPLFSGKADKVRPGSLIKVEGFALTAAGLVREPRVCKDTEDSWLAKY